MSNKPLKTQGFAQGIYQQSSVQMHDLDTVRYLSDGRAFAYAQAGAVALAAGKMTMGASPDSNANDETLAASAAIGATVLSVTFGGAVTANVYKDGWIWPNDDTGEGSLYQVKSHAAGTTAVQVYLKDPVRVAMTAGATTISAIANRQAGVLLGTHALTSAPAGIPPIAVTEAYYFWNQVKGPAVCLANGTLVIGNQAGIIAASGALTPLGASDVIGSLGVVMSVNAATEYALINLAIPGY